MITLKEYIHNIKKEDLYNYYQTLEKEPLSYDKLTRTDIYNAIIKIYQDDPEIILRICCPEEMDILKSLIDNKIPSTNYSYIDYLLFLNLKNNYLIIEQDNEFFIPDDLLNYIKMAINLYDEEECSKTDLYNSVILGIIRIKNVISINDLINTLSHYNCILTKPSLQAFIKNNPKLKNKLTIKKYQGINYIISLEHNYYKEILKLRKEIPSQEYILEEIISYGKYKINLFREPVYKCLSLLETYIEPYSIDQIIDEIIEIEGLQLSDDIIKEALKDMPKLYSIIQDIMPYFPIWLYDGHTKKYLKVIGSSILPRR